MRTQTSVNMSGQIRSRPLMLCMTSASFSTANRPCDNISVRLPVCFYHLRRFKKIRQILGSSIASRIVPAFDTSCIDYCNALLASLPQSNIMPLQRVQNAAVHLVSRLQPCDHVTSSLRELHWLTIRYRIIFKLCLMMHNAYVGCSPCYIIDTLSPIANMCSRSMPFLGHNDKLFSFKNK